jgi:uncharacterized damage-inducible protein DinB
MKQTSPARTLAHHFAAMAYNNGWANHRLHGAVAKLQGGEFEAPRAGFFPSLRGTLNHIVTVDWMYVDALERAFAGQPPEPRIARFFEPEEPLIERGALRAAQRDVDLRLVRLCVALTESSVDTPVGITRPEGVVVDPAHRVLAHLFQHQIHHRGQAHAMLSGTSVAPPQVDEFFCSNEAHLRAAELAELGWSEAEIWGA